MTGTVQSVLPPLELVNRILQLAQQRGMSYTQVAQNQIDFRRGSQAAIRLKGAIFSKTSEFPVVAVIRCDPQGAGSLAVINSLDDLGFGLKIGITKKYETAVREFGEIMAGLVTDAARQ